MAMPTSDKIHDPSVVKPVVGSTPPATLTANAGPAATRTRTPSIRASRLFMERPFGLRDGERRSCRCCRSARAEQGAERPPGPEEEDAAAARQRLSQWRSEAGI